MRGMACDPHPRRDDALSRSDARGPVSRVLSTMSPWMGGHSSRRRIAPSLKQPTRAVSAETGLAVKAARRPYSVLLPVGFTVPPSVAGDAVRSYRTLSISLRRSVSDLLSVALSLGSLQPAVSRHRHFVEPGLSSPWKLPATPRPPGPLAGALYTAPRRPSSPLIHRPLALAAAGRAGWRGTRHR
jgi:hypothetical protein